MRIAYLCICNLLTYYVMNDKERRIKEVLKVVVECCRTEINGAFSITENDVLSNCRKSNAVMTRCIFITQMRYMGFTTDTIAMYLNRTKQAVSKLITLGNTYRVQSKAYQIAEAQSTIRCKLL